MSITESDVAVGKCYATTTNQHRRVVAIDGGKVTYESWGGNVLNTGAPLSRNTAKIETFVDAVEKEIPCDPSLPQMPKLD
ncbi:hypothetical protein JCM17960_05410 [Magnetospira thiophila]